MKLLLAVIIYLLMGGVFCWGILLAVKGNPWLLIVSFLIYVLSFAKIGCLPSKSLH